MNRFVRFLTLLTLLHLTAGCDKMLSPDPVGVQTVDGTFTDFAGTVSAINGVYNLLSGGDLYRGNLNLLYIDYASDDVINTSKTAASSYSPLDYFELPVDNGLTFGLWNDFYRIIYRANIITNRVPGFRFPLPSLATRRVAYTPISLSARLSLCGHLLISTWCGYLAMYHCASPKSRALPK
ncbi:hypothetical protein GO730_21880 [Spirosoma sp. HMF3257]|uniref:RagB/SusD family nutrient uptake outer membrane protein n=1 Tax=Spirosoma telluris TaxID=2183553 RepID=A0A327NLR5_9BACT|nr:hypothetical protein [Spirosoma telluris]RAI76162.1 hypothetical protein HMF3257_21805 [Spirosoma telluris]